MFSPFFNDFDDDPFFGPHMNPMSHMHNMMNSMNSLIANPFGVGNSLMSRQSNNGLLPFPGFDMESMFSNPMLPPNATNHSFSTSTVVSMTHGPDGRPQIYKSSASVKAGPGGVRETQRSEINSMTGTKKMAIGHHIGDKSHIVEQQQNLNTGDREENEELVNLDEDELDGFKREWEVKARQHKRHDPLRLMNTPKIRSSPLALPPALTQSPKNNRKRKANDGSSCNCNRKCNCSNNCKSKKTQLENNTSTPGRRSHLLGSSSSSGHSRKNRNLKSVSGNQNDRN